MAHILRNPASQPTDSAALTSPPLQAFSKWANLAVRGAHSVLAGFRALDFSSYLQRLPLETTW